MESELACLQVDRAEDAVDILEDIIIPETQDPVTLFRQVGGALRVIIGLVQVLASIKLDDQFLARGAEIDDERSNRMLAPELDAFELVVSQP